MSVPSTEDYDDLDHQIAELMDEDKGYLAVTTAGHKRDPLTNMTVRIYMLIPTSGLAAFVSGAELLGRGKA